MNSPIVTRSGSQNAKIQTRAMVKSKSTPASTAPNAASGGGASAQSSAETRRPNVSLMEAKRRARLLKAQNSSGAAMSETVTDIFQNAVNAKGMMRKATALIYDDSMSEHCCLWDKLHPECPERFTRVLQRCGELQLPERCLVLGSRAATKAEILMLHSEAHYERLGQTAGVPDAERMEELSSRYDSVYIHPSTFQLSLLASGSTIELVDQILTGHVQNGMAIVRPPGHHAMKAEFNGYCFFNNVALAAQHALDKHKLQRVLIIDYDVHHGQGTQRFFYHDPRVLYFSIHRYEHGSFWPSLRESDYYAIGAGNGTGFNFNVPLNATGMGNGDYLAIFQQLLLPVALEYQPELIIVSAGYDAALGCPEGEMEVTPACYAHLLHPLLRLAESRMAVVLEGGYCLDSLAEGAALTLRALLGDTCPPLVERLEMPSVEVREAILNCIFTHRPYWRCLQLQATYTVEELNNVEPGADGAPLHRVQRTWLGAPPPPERYPTRDTAPIIAPEVTQRHLARLQVLRAETKLSMPSVRVCYAYDEQMLEHCNLHETQHPEQPQRIRQIYQMHNEYQLLERMERVPSRIATTDEICLVHTRAHLNLVRRLMGREPPELERAGAKFNSVYFHPRTFDCATRAAGGVLEVVDHVLHGKARSGICIVRPPGHHAEPDQPHGFCIFNNVAIAAQYAIRDYGLQRVLIVDWDVHHGNGTQHIFEANPKVLYISVHRYEHGAFFPKGPDGNYDVVGKQAGRGYNVNIPWNKKGMGDLEYALAFQQLIMPIAYEFEPQLVLVSAGFDAAIGDPLGGCKVTPEGYGLFTHWLSALAGGRVIVCLEGGYNVHSISYAMTMCTKTLLGDPVPTPQFNASVQRAPSAAHLSCLETLQSCLLTQRQHWKALAFCSRLPQFDSENNNEDFLAASLQQLNIANDDALGASGGPIGDQPDCAMDGPSGSKPKVKVKSLAEYVGENKEQEMFAIYPLKTCPHLNELQPERAPQTINTKAECSKCGSMEENWMCLSCFAVCCGYYMYEHMEQHFRATRHSFVLSFRDLSVWCYNCTSYIDNPRLFVYQNLAHIDKFDEPMLWTHKCPRFRDWLNSDNDDDGDSNDDDVGGGNSSSAASNFYIQLERNN